MTATRQLVLIVSLIAAFVGNNYAGSMKREIATGAAADSANNQNTVAITQYGSLGAAAAAILAGLPGLGGLLGKIGGAQTIERVINDGTRLVAKKGADPGAIYDLAKLVLERGSPEAMRLLGQLNQHIGDSPPTPAPGEPPPLQTCLDQLVRRVELDAAARISGATSPKGA